MASGSEQYTSLNTARAKGLAPKAGTGKKSSAKQRTESRKQSAKDFDNNLGKGGDTGF